MDLQKKNRMKLLFRIASVLNLLIGAFVMYLSSTLWIGSKEDWVNLIENEFWLFYFFRCIFTFAIGLFFIFINFVLLKFFGLFFKYAVNTTKRELVIELAILFLLTLLFVGITLTDEH